MKSCLRIALLSASALVAGTVAAGEGGVAGSAAFDIETSGASSVVNYATMAGAVGKDTAYAGSNASGDASAVIDSFAAGTGGALTLPGTSNYITAIAEDAARATAQGNTMNTGVFLDFDATAGTADITNSP